MLSRLAPFILLLAAPTCLCAGKPKKAPQPYTIEFQVVPGQFPKNSELRVELRAIVCVRDTTQIMMTERPVSYHPAMDSETEEDYDPNAAAVVSERHTVATRATEPLLWSISFDDEEKPIFDGPPEYGEFILPQDPVTAKLKSGAAIVFSGQATLLIDGKKAGAVRLRSPMMKWSPSKHGWGLKLENEGIVALLDSDGNVEDSSATIGADFFAPPNYSVEIVVLPGWAAEMRDR